MTTHTLPLPEPLARLAIEHGVVLVALDEDVQALLRIAPAGFFPNPDPRRCSYQPGDRLKFETPWGDGQYHEGHHNFEVLGPIASVEAVNTDSNDVLIFAASALEDTYIDDIPEWFWLIRMEAGK